MGATFDRKDAPQWYNRPRLRICQDERYRLIVIRFDEIPYGSWLFTTDDIGCAMGELCRLRMHDPQIDMNDVLEIYDCKVQRYLSAPELQEQFELSQGLPGATQV